MDAACPVAATCALDRRGFVMRCFRGPFAGIVLFLLLFAGFVQAQEPGLYEGEVPVASQSEADRLAALPAALAQVVAKVGGASVAHVATDDAASLLQQYRYRRDVENVDG